MEVLPRDKKLGADEVKPGLGSLSVLTHAVKVAEAGNGEVTKLIESASFKVTPRALSRLIMACRNAKQWQKALEILRAARDRDISTGEPPNFFTFSAAVSVCCKSRRVPESLWLLSEMKEAALDDPSLAPDSIVYRLVILCCVREGRHDEAIQLYMEMSEEGIEADDQTLDHVLSAWLAKKEWLMAVEVLHKIHSRCRVLPLVRYNHLLEACAADGDLDMTTEVFLTMQVVGVVPDASTYHHIMQGIEVAGSPQMALELLEDMKLVGVSVLPRTCACLLRVVLGSGRVDFMPKLVKLLEGYCNSPEANTPLHKKLSRTPKECEDSAGELNSP